MGTSVSFFFQAEDGIRDLTVTGVQTCALPIWNFNARFELAKVEASLHNYRQSLDVAGPIVAQLNGSEDGILLLATDYGSLGEKEELSSLVRTWQQLPAPSDESFLEFGNVLTMFGMTLEAKQVFEAAEAKIAEHPSPALALQLGKSYLSIGV